MLFDFKKQAVLGIDFGTSYIKAVELTLKDGRPHLTNYGQVEMSFTEGQETFRFQSPEEKISAHFEALLERLDVKAKLAAVALPAFTGLITLIEMPAMKIEEIEQAIRFEAPKYIPLPIDEVALSWEVVSQKDNMLEVLLVAALNKEVGRYEQLVTKAGFKLDLLELEIFSLARAAADPLGTHLVVDLGSRATNIILVAHGAILMNRSLNSGGNEITTAIVESLRVTWGRAEQLKRSDNDLLNGQLSNFPLPTLQLIQYEASRLLEAYRRKYPEVNVDDIILSGGGAKMQGLDRYCEQLFHLPIKIADPWHDIAYDAALSPAVERYGPSFSVAVGLALGGLEKFRAKL